MPYSFWEKMGTCIGIAYIAVWGRCAIYRMFREWSRFEYWAFGYLFDSNRTVLWKLRVFVLGFAVVVAFILLMFLIAPKVNEWWSHD